MTRITKDQSNQIPCPVLRAVALEGDLPIAPNGEVKVSDVKDVLERRLNESGALAGMGAELAGDVANGIAKLFVNTSSQTFNLFGMNVIGDGGVRHGWDSGVLTHNADGSFNAEMFQRSFGAHSKAGEDGKRYLYAGDLAQVAIDNQKRTDPDAQGGSRIKAGQFNLIEFEALLGVIGQPDKSGKPRIELGALRELYEHGKIPDGVANRKPTTALDLISSNFLPAIRMLPGLVAGDLNGMLKLVAHAMTIGTHSGQADAGARLALGGQPPDPAVANAARSAGKSAGCPFLGGNIQSPARIEDSLKAHETK